MEYSLNPLLRDQTLSAETGFQHPSPPASHIPEWDLNHLDIESYSQLQRLKDPPLVSLLEGRENLFANLALDPDLLGTGLEGVTGIDVAKWYYAVINSNLIFSNKSSLLDLKNALELYIAESATLLLLGRKKPTSVKEERLIVKTHAGRILQTIKDLQTNESILLPSGWNGTPGHRMVLQVKRTGLHSFDLFLFNAWENVDQGGLQRFDKIKTCPLFYFKNVPDRNLLFSAESENYQPALFERLIAFQLLPTWHTPVGQYEYSYSKFMNAFAPFIEYLVPPDPETSELMTGQRSGTCGKRSLDAAIHYHLRSCTEYKMFALDSKLLGLVNGYYAFEKYLSTATDLNYRYRHELWIAAEHLLGRLRKDLMQSYEGAPQLTTADVKMIFATVKDIMNRLQATEALLEQTIKRGHEILPTEVTSLNSQIEWLRSLSPLHKTKVTSGLLPEASPAFLKKSSPDATELLSWLKGISLVSTIAVEKAIDAIPLPKSYPDTWWSKVPVDQLLPCMTQIDLLADAYSRAITDPLHPSLPRHHNTLMCMQAMIHALAWRYDCECYSKGKESLLTHASIYDRDLAVLLRNDPLLIIKEPAVWQKRKELLAYFNAVRKQDNEIFCFDERKLKPFFKTAEAKLYISLLDRNPEMASIIEQAFYRTLFLQFGEYNKLDLRSVETLCIPIITDLGDRPALSPNASIENDYTQWSVLKMLGADHIALAKKMALRSRLLMGGDRAHARRQILQVSVQADGTLTYSGNQFTIVSKETDTLPNLGATQIPPSVVLQLKPYMRYLQHHIHTPDGVPTQGQHQALAMTNDLGRILGSACEPHLMISTLIGELIQATSLIDQPHHRHIVNQLLFKPVVKGGATGNTEIPLFNDLRHKPDLVTASLRAYISKSLKTHFTLTPGREPNLVNCLFILQLADDLTHAFRQIHQKNPAPPLVDLETWGELFNWIESTLTVESIHRPIFHHLRVASYAGTDASKWDLDTWIDLMSCFISSKSGNIEPEQAAIAQRVEHFVAELHEPFSVLMQDVTHRDACCQQVLNRLLEHAMPNMKWRHREGLSFETDGWMIDFALGKAFSAQGIVRFTKVPDDSEAYKALLGSQTKQGQQTGNIFYFNDPKLGRLRLMQEDVTTIQREISGRWWELLLTDSSYLTPIPRALQAYHHHWLQLEQDQQPTLLLTCIADGKPTYEMRSDGYIHSLTNPEVTIENASSYPIIEAIEDPSYILVHTRSGKRTHLMLPRYELEFQAINSEWIWKQNTDYRLVHQSRCFCLGGYRNYLLMQHKEDNSLQLLLPLEPSANSYSSKGLTQSAKYALNTPLDRLGYRLLPIENNKVMPINIEDNLLVARLFLIQKRYEDAIFYLGRVTLSDAICQPAREELIKILQSGEASQDYSANAAAIKLQAFWRAIHLDASIDKYLSFPNQRIHADISSIYISYLETIGNVYEVCRLTLDQEMDIIKRCPPHISLNRRKDFLETGLYEPIVHKTSPYDTDTALVLIRSAALDFRDFSHSYSAESDLVEEARRLVSASQAERNARLYHLQQIDVEQPQQFELQTRRLLYFICLYPDQAGPIPRQNASLEEVFAWCKQLEALMNSQGVWLAQSKFSVTHSKQRQKIKPFNRTAALADKPLSNPLPSSYSIDQFLNQLGDRFTLRHSYPIGNSVTLSIHNSQLSIDEQPFFSVIEREMKAYESELMKGRARLVEERPPELKLEMAGKLLHDLTELECACSQKAETELKAVKRLAQTTPSGSYLLSHQLQQLQYRAPSISLAHLTRAAVRQNVREYQRLNPHLDEKSAAELHQHIIEYMALETSLRQIRSILDPLKKIVEGNINASSLEEVSLALGARRRYHPSEDIGALYFEFTTKMRGTEAQVRILRQVTELVLCEGSKAISGLVFQLMMGGGKTSFILSRLLELIASKGDIPFFIVHPSQLSTIKGNLKKWQRERFDKDVISIDVGSKDLNQLEVLKWVQTMLRQAKQHLDAILMSSSTAALIELELQFQLNHYSGQSEQTEKLELLLSINRLMEEVGIAVLDEVDTTLTINQRVHIPLGSRTSLKDTRLQLLTAIYEILTSVELEPLLQLQKNDQWTLGFDRYKEKVVPALITRLATHHHSLMLQESHLHPSFLRYVLGEINPVMEDIAFGNVATEEQTNLQAQQDIVFLRYLHFDLYRSSQPKKQEAARLIALTAMLIKEVLPVTLNKEGNRHYGRADSSDAETGKTVFYLGTRVPAQTEIGNAYEAMCYRLQTALHEPHSKAMIRAFADLVSRLAQRSSIELGVPFNATPEAKEFFSLTQVHLHELEKGDNLGKATDKVNANIKTKLIIESELASAHLTYFSQFLNASPISLLDQFKRVVACSGTIYNSATYHRGKITHISRDAGAEGKVLYTLLEKAVEEKRLERKSIALVSSDNLTDFLTEVLSDLPSDVHALMDGGGLLKRYSNLEVAQGILDHSRKTSKIRYVLFLHRYLDTQESSKTLKESMAILHTDGRLELLEDVSPATLKQHKVDPEHLMVYYDELRTTGLDVRLPIAAQGVGTVDPKNAIRYYSQMALRLRGLLAHQRMVTVVANSSRELFLGRANTLLDIIQTGVKNQAIRTAKEVVRSFQIQVHNAFRSRLMHTIRHSSVVDAVSLSRQFEPIFVQTIEDDPFVLYGYLKRPLSGLLMLEQLCQNQIRLFDQCAAAAPNAMTASMREGALTDIQNLMTDARSSDFNDIFSITFYSSANETLDMQVEVNMELNQQQEISLSQDLQIESTLSSIDAHAQIFQERAWVWSALKDFDHNRLGPRIIPLWSLFQEGLHTLYRGNYTRVFPANLYITENLQYTFTQLQPVFHATQKPAAHVLVRMLESDKLEFVLLSQGDARFFHDLLSFPANSWLMDVHGNLIRASKTPIPDRSNHAFHNELRVALWHIHLFNGQLQALEADPILTKQLVGQDDEDHKLLFLSEKVRQDPERHSHFQHSSLLINLRGHRAREGHQLLARWERDKQEQIRLHSLADHEIASVSPKLVPFLSASRVALLQTPEQVAEVTEEQVAFLTTAQLNLLPSEKVAYIAVHRVRELSIPSLIQAIGVTQVNGLVASQMNHISPSVVHHIRDAKLLEQVTHPNVIRGFIAEQLSWLQPQHINFISPSLIPLLEDPHLISLITNPDLIAAFTSRHVRYTQARQVPHLAGQAVAAIDQKEFIPLVSPQYANFINPKFVTLLNRDQRRLLTNPELLRRIEASHVSDLPDEALPHLDALSQLIYVQPTRDFAMTDQQYQDLEQAFKKNPLSVPKEWMEVLEKHTQEYFTRLQVLALFSKSTRNLNIEYSLLTSTFNQFNLNQLKAELKRCAAGAYQLRLSDARIIPDEIRFLAHTPLLSIRSDQIDQLPSDLPWHTITDLQIIKGENEVSLNSLVTLTRKMTNLTSLKVTGQRLGSLPDELAQLPIRDLDLSDNCFSHIPEVLFKMQLKNLRLSKNRIETLPKDISRWSQLTSLFLDGNKITALHPTLKRLSLITLDLSENPLTRPVIDYLPVCIVDLQLNHLPARALLNFSLRQFPVLQALGLNGCASSTLFDLSLGKLRTLSLLQFQGRYFPKEVLNSALSELTIGGELGEFPDLSLFPLGKHLTRLQVLDTSLKSFPSHLLSLPRLSQLDLTYCGLKDIPKHLPPLRALTSIRLDHNEIEDIPVQLLQSPIHMLSLRFNHIKEIPNKLPTLENDLAIDLKGNQIHDLPETIQRTSSYKIWLEENPIDLKKLQQLALQTQNHPKINLHFHNESIPEPISQNEVSLYSPDQPSFSWYRAVMRGDEDALMHWLEQDLNSSAFLEGGDNLLHLACQQGLGRIIRELIRRRLPLDRRDVKGQTAFMLASKAPGIPFEILFDLAEAGAMISEHEFNELLDQVESTASFALKSKQVEQANRLLMKLGSSTNQWKIVQERLKRMAHIPELVESTQLPIPQLFRVVRDQLLENRSNIDIREIPIIEFRRLLTYCLAQHQPEWVSPLILKRLRPTEGHADAIITGFFLDKAWRPDLDERISQLGASHIAASIFASALTQYMRVNPEGGLFANVWKQLHRIVNECAAFMALSINMREKEIAHLAAEIIERIRTLQPGAMCLIPVQSKEHMMLLEIKGEVSGQRRLKLINTGMGVQYHPQWSGSNRYQAYIVYHHVPNFSLMSLTNWQELVGLTEEPGDGMKKHYELIRQLAAGGQIETASSATFDYVTVQDQGTCVFLPWWRMTRYFLQDNFSTEEGYSIYLKVKSQIATQIYEANHPTNARIAKLAQGKLAKSSALASLDIIATDPSQFDTLMKFAHQQVRDMKDYALLNDLESLTPSNASARFIVLRHMCKVLADICIKSGSSSLLNQIQRKPELELVTQIILDRAEVEKGYTLLLDGLLTSRHWNRLGETLALLLLSERFSAVAWKLLPRYLTPTVVQPRLKQGIQEAVDKICVVMIKRHQLGLLVRLASNLQQSHQAFSTTLAERLWRRLATYGWSYAIDLARIDHPSSWQEKQLIVMIEALYESRLVSLLDEVSAGPQQVYDGYCDLLFALLNKKAWVLEQNDESIKSIIALIWHKLERAQRLQLIVDCRRRYPEYASFIEEIQDIE